MATGSYTLFMIHGMCGASWHWANYRSFFEERGCACVTPTLRYHDMDPDGEPDSLLGNTSLLDYARDLEEEIQNLGVTPVIVGHSMGGLLAQMLGSRGLGKALVLLNPASPSGILALRFSVIRCFWSVMTTWAFWRKPFRFTFDEAAYGILNKCPTEEQEQVYRRLVYESGRAAAEIGFWLLDSKGSAKVDDSKIACPVLIVAGGQDRVTPAPVVRKVREKYATLSTYKEYADHGHWVLGEPGWETIAQDIAAWIRENVAC
ncbi:MAG: alpha/beta hydrolase [Deltaproteobacteria bacterium]|jgi:pimeloyl-ACP methyl ester carboxylesterase